MLSRHIKELAGFTSQRSCERRLKKLVETGYLEYQKIIYGIPRIYQNTKRAEAIAQIYTGNWKRKIKLEQITHDISVLDVVIALNKSMKIPYENIVSERQLHKLDGFSVRNHRPDFVFDYKDKKVCVELEFSMKAKNRFEKNIKENFLAYSIQLWVVQNKSDRIGQFLEKQKLIYPNIRIRELKEVLNHENH